VNGVNLPKEPRPGQFIAVHESWNKKLPSLDANRQEIRELTPKGFQNPYMPVPKVSEEASIYTNKFLSRPESIDANQQKSNEI